MAQTRFLTPANFKRAQQRPLISNALEVEKPRPGESIVKRFSCIAVLTPGLICLSLEVIAKIGGTCDRPLRIRMSATTVCIKTALLTRVMCSQAQIICIQYCEVIVSCASAARLEHSRSLAAPQKRICFPSGRSAPPFPRGETRAGN